MDADGNAGAPGGTGARTERRGTRRHGRGWKRRGTWRHRRGRKRRGYPAAPDAALSALPFQFLHPTNRQSEYPVYELESTVQLEFPQKERPGPTSALCHKQELTVRRHPDRSFRRGPSPGQRAPEAGKYITLTDGRLLSPEEKYQSRLWSSDEGLFLTGPGLPEDDQPVESMYGADSQVFLRHTEVCVTAMRRVSSFQPPQRMKDSVRYALRSSISNSPWNFL